MKVGTKSILFGHHQFLLHPIMVAVAWWKLYGFPWDPRLWLSFFVHDLGYLGKEKMDDEMGETHPEVGARIMRIFGDRWSKFVLLHSRFYANTLGLPYSDLCVADKYCYLLYPTWLIVLLCRLSGEDKEYMTLDEKRFNFTANSFRELVEMMKEQNAKWLKEHEAGQGNKFVEELRK